MKNYKIDPLHSYVGFKVKHMMISNVNGNFTKFDAKMTSATEDFSDAQIEFECEVDSISTNISDRDAHLKSPDFFASDEYPTINFISTSVEKSESEKYKVTGDLTIKGVTKSIELEGEYNGNDIDMYGNTKYGFEMFGKINRTDFGLTFNLLSGKGNSLVGEEIKLIINIQMVENI
jgi:polyisoprenoid-binding protein YceI